MWCGQLCYGVLGVCTVEFLKDAQDAQAAYTGETVTRIVRYVQGQGNGCCWRGWFHHIEFHYGDKMR